MADIDDVNVAKRARLATAIEKKLSDLFERTGPIFGYAAGNQYHLTKALRDEANLKTIAARPNLSADKLKATIAEGMKATSRVIRGEHSVADNVSDFWDAVSSDPERTAAFEKKVARSAALNKRLGIVEGTFPKLLRGAFVPPGIDDESAKEAQEAWVRSKLGGGA